MVDIATGRARPAQSDGGSFGGFGYIVGIGSDIDGMRVIIMIAALLLGGTAAVVLFAAVVRVDGLLLRSADGSSSVPTEAAALLARFVDRSQRFRRNGAIAGIVVAVAVHVVKDAVAPHPAENALNIATVATVGLAGSICGSILGGAYRFRRPNGPRVASLTPRYEADYRDPKADRRERLVGGLAAVGVVGALISGIGLQSAVVIACAIATLAILRRWAIRAIAFRARPAVPPGLAAADERVRQVAASAGISQPMVTLGLLLVSTQWFAVTPRHMATEGATQVISAVGPFGGILLFLTGCAWWWENRSFGLTTEELVAGARPRSNIGTTVVLALVAVLVSGLLVSVARGA